jgi:tRNA A37 threonylcarbamoyladenosine synthetase subunit TsaC/SUA5/YrdC
MDIETILPKKGVTSPCPATLRRPQNLVATEIHDAVIELLKSGKVVAYGGLSLFGENDDEPVCIVGILQGKGLDNLKGWILTFGNPEKEMPVFKHIDTAVESLIEDPFPTAMTCFVGEADEKLSAADASLEELQAVARFILPFIEEGDMLQGIEW